VNELKIRLAESGDKATIVAANLALARETEDKTLDEAAVSGGVDALLTDASLGRYYLAERDGRIVGQLGLTWEWSDWRNGLFWWIQSVYVAREARGSGIFRALYEFVAGAARDERNVAGLRLYVDKNNERAANVYRRLGMRVTHYDMLEVDFTLKS
jgi:ribosomal protein S18 acetylase RimI-like enzyme